MVSPTFLPISALASGEEIDSRAGLDVGLVHADDLVGGFLFGLLVHQPDMRAELHVVAGQRRRVDHLDRGDDLLEFGDAALDEGLAFARGVVFGVFRQVAMRARLGDRADDRRALLATSACRSSSSNRCRPGAVIGNFCTARSFESRQGADVTCVGHGATRDRRGRASCPAATERLRTIRESRTAAARLQAFPPSAPRSRAPRPGRRPWWCSAARRGSARCGGCRSCRRPTAAPEAVLITSCTSPERIASTQCGRPSSTLLTTRDRQAGLADARGGAAGGQDGEAHLDQAAGQRRPGPSCRRP